MIRKFSRRMLKVQHQKKCGKYEETYHKFKVRQIKV